MFQLAFVVLFALFVINTSMILSSTAKPSSLLLISCSPPLLFLSIFSYSPHLLLTPHQPTILLRIEKNAYVGGVWKHIPPEIDNNNDMGNGNKDNGKEKGGAMYGTLTTNLPKEIMAFWKDYPFRYPEQEEEQLQKGVVQSELEGDRPVKAARHSISSSSGSSVTSEQTEESLLPSYATHAEVQAYLTRFRWE
jgi:hypothetical protein